MAFVGEAFTMPFPPQTRVCKGAGGKAKAFRTESCEQGGRNQDLITAKGTRKNMDSNHQIHGRSGLSTVCLPHFGRPMKH
jgi:hypothetical protein